MAQPTKANVRHFMRRQLELWPDYSDYGDLIDDSGEAQAGKLAEAAAQEFDGDDWLDDSNHWVWDVAVEEAERWEKAKTTNPRSKKIVTYTYRGNVERVGSRGYKWHRGYSETTAQGGVLYPWMTKAECRADASARGAKAIFQEEATAVENPDYLTVTADSEEEAERKARKFGRVLYVEKVSPGKFRVGVHRRRNNPIKDMPGGSVTGCIAQNQDKDDPGAYCAAIADRIEPGWRSKKRKRKNPDTPNTTDLVRKLKF